jgi:hypothetical protein
MLRGPRNVRPQDMQNSKLLSAMRGGLSLYMIEVGAQGHILKSVKERLRSLFWACFPAGHRLGIWQMMKDVIRISLMCLLSIFQARNDPVWYSPHLVTRHIDGVLTEV